jgi:hypothetical protein
MRTAGDIPAAPATYRTGLKRNLAGGCSFVRVSALDGHGTHNLDDSGVQTDRLGTGTDRVYTLTAAAKDLAGNVATATSTCIVPHDQK